MKRNEYNKHLEKIRCTEEFRNKMEERLKASPSEIHEYADTVDGTERAEKHSAITRYLVPVAACAAVAVGVGFIWKTANSPMRDDFTSNIEQTTAHDLLQDGLPFENFAESEVAVTIVRDFDHTYPIASLSEQCKNELAELFSTLDWTPVEVHNALGVSEIMSFSYNDGEKDIYIEIDCIGRATVTKEGSDGTKESCLYQFVPHDFYGLMEIINNNILSNSFAAMPINAATAAYGYIDYAPEFPAELEGYLNKFDYSEKIELYEPVKADGEYILLEIGFSRVEIYHSSLISVTYMQSDDNQVGCYYQLPNGVYNDINDLIEMYRKQSETGIEPNVDDISQWISQSLPETKDDGIIRFMTDAGQFSNFVEYRSDYCNVIPDLLRYASWEAADISEFTYTNFITIGDCLYNTDTGLLHITNSELVYRISDEYKAEFDTYFEKIKKDDELGAILHRIYNGQKSQSTMVADYTGEYDIEYTEINGDCAQVFMYHPVVSGRLEYDLTADRYYMDGTGKTDHGEEFKYEVIGKDGETVYVEHGEKIDKLNYTRAFFTDENGEQTSYQHYISRFEGISAEADYFFYDDIATQFISELKRDIMADRIRNHYTITEGANGTITLYISSGPIGERSGKKLTLEIDYAGTVTAMEYIENETVKYAIKLENVIYDADTIEPVAELTETEEKYFTMSCEEYAESVRLYGE